MSYRLEGKDLVISGFEQGIASTPYQGIADMRNMEILSIPGESFVQFANTGATQPPVKNAVAFTAQDSGDTITPTGGTTSFYVGTAITLNTNNAAGLSTGVVYYVFNITATTFQVRLAPGTGSAIAITSNGSGTFTTYQYGNQRGTSAMAPISYWVDRTGAFSGTNGVLLMDGSNYLWLMQTSATNLPADTLIFLGNIGGLGASSLIISGVSVWNGYILLFGESSVGVDYARVSTLLSSGPAAAWTYNWVAAAGVGTNNVNGRVGMLVSQEDGNLYWTSAEGVGSLVETPGSTFNPATPATYSITGDAITVPESDESTCLAELGTNILIGGRRTFVYVWDKISLGFNNLLNIPDVFTTAIVATSQNAYVFSGNRGRIYITNGSGIDMYKKIPDYITGSITPVIQWRDANFYRNQLIFSFDATTNGGTTLNTSAAWSIDLDTDAFRVLNKTTNTGYTGSTAMVVQRPPGSSGSVTTGTTGTGITVGWYSGSTYGVDIGSSLPYVAGESYLETDMIPVGTYLSPFSPSQIEWKTSVPLVNGESISIYWRENLSDSFTLLGTSTVSGTTLTGTTTGATVNAKRISDYYKANFDKVQWAQLKAVTTSTATTPSYVRLTELRIRDYPSDRNLRT